MPTIMTTENTRRRTRRTTGERQQGCPHPTIDIPLVSVWFAPPTRRFMPPTTASDAASSIDVEADPQRVYELISDPGTLAELAAEYSSFRWLNGAMRATVGARFKGGNKNGWRR